MLLLLAALCLPGCTEPAPPPAAPAPPPAPPPGTGSLPLIDPALLELRLAETLLGLESWASSHEPLMAPDSTHRAYAAAGGALLWSDPQAALATLEAAASHGYAPSDYHGDAIRQLVHDTGDAELDLQHRAQAHAELDLLATDAWLALAAHLSTGRLDPTTYDPRWFARREEIDVVPLLLAPERSADPAAALHALAPQDPRYQATARALSDLRALGPGERWAGAPEADPAALIQALEVNLERWRWLPDPPASAWVEVNVPEFRLLAGRGDAGLPQRGPPGPPHLPDGVGGAGWDPPHRRGHLRAGWPGGRGPAEAPGPLTSTAPPTRCRRAARRPR